MNGSVGQNELLSTLNRLEALIKGVSEEELEKSQLQTGPGSSQGQMANMNQEVYGDGLQDRVVKDGSSMAGESGTDYQEPGTEKGMGSISVSPMRERPARGPASAGVSRLAGSTGALSGGAQGMGKAADDDSDEDDEDDDDSDDDNGKNGKEVNKSQMDKACPVHGNKGCPDSCESLKKHTSKSLRRSIPVEESEEASKGFEVTEFMFYLRKSFNDSLVDMRHRLVNRIAAYHEDRGDFAKSLSKAVASISEKLALTKSEVEQVEEEPARAAKSITKASEIETRPEKQLEKSFADTIQRRQMNVDKLTNLLMKGEPGISAMDIVNYESGGELPARFQSLLSAQ